MIKRENEDGNESIQKINRIEGINHDQAAKKEQASVQIERDVDDT